MKKHSHVYNIIKTKTPKGNYKAKDEIARNVMLDYELWNAPTHISEIQVETKKCRHLHLI